MPRLQRTGHVLVKRERHVDLVLRALAEALLEQERRFEVQLAAARAIAKVNTASFSGNAFSVKNARGKFSSPRGHAGSAQKPRRWPTSASISCSDSASPNAGIRRSSARIPPPSVDDGRPVEVGLRRGERAVGEIGQRRVEADDRSRLALAVRPVAGRTRGLIELLGRHPSAVRLRAAPAPVRRGRRQRPDDEQAAAPHVGGHDTRRVSGGQRVRRCASSSTAATTFLKHAHRRW